MSTENVFFICNNLALVSWIILIFFTFWKNRDRFIFSIVIVLLAILYSWIMLSNFSAELLRDFSTLDGISRLFTNKTLLLGGWIHYLAFDLFTGIYIMRNARENGLNHWIIVPALLLTFLLGPFGLLVYLVIKSVKTKTLFPIK